MNPVKENHRSNMPRQYAAILSHPKIIIFTAVKNNSILHGRVIVIYE